MLGNPIVMSVVGGFIGGIVGGKWVSGHISRRKDVHVEFMFNKQTKKLKCNVSLI